jgi:S-adenosylmethionine:tRNA ribosyltransferase-isomerase
MKPDPLLFKGIKDIDLADYLYDLPEEKIAQFPVDIRDSSKLLIAGKDYISESVFHKIDEHLPVDHLLIFNNSRVVRARLNFKKESGAQIEIFCIEPLVPSDYERSFNSRDQVIWKCIIGNLKKWKKGILTMSFSHHDKVYAFTAEKMNQLDGIAMISHLVK